MKKEINRLSFLLPAKSGSPVLKSKGTNLLSSKRKWILPFLFLALCYTIVELCYCFVDAKNNSALFLFIAIAIVILLFLVLFAISIKIKKQSTASQKEINELKERLQKKNQSLESLVLFSEQQKSKLVNTVLLKEKLVSIVSHDMRVPVNSFKKLVSDYENGFISSRMFTIGMLETKNELLKVDDVVFDLLNLPENRKKGANLEMIGFQKINEIIESAIFLYKKYTKNKKIDIIPYIQLKENMCLCIPMRDLEIILRSLISNAIKFSKYESIIIITLKADADSSESVAKLSIKDFGRGIQPSTLTLMNSTRGISGMSTLDEGSLGVGLRIVFDVIENNSLQYNIESELGKGTEFSVNIPLVSC